MATLHPRVCVYNSNSFKKLDIDRIRIKLYLEIEEFLLRRSMYPDHETQYFDITDFVQRECPYYNANDINSLFMSELIVQLTQLGWKTTLSFGGTGLFIYKSERPKNCYDDGF